MGVEPENEFLSDDELKSLLERWNAPGPSRVLDKRIANSFAREFSGADGLSQSVLLTHRREEVVSMKFCSRCEEEFADKFSFCPVDGTPLTSVSQRVEEEPSVVTAVSHDDEPSVTTKARDSVLHVVPIIEPAPRRPRVDQPAYAVEGHSQALVPREEYHLTIMDDAGLVSRLS